MAISDKRLREIAAIPDEAIDTSDIPEPTPEQLLKIATSNIKVVVMDRTEIDVRVNAIIQAAAERFGGAHNYPACGSAVFRERLQIRIVGEIIMMLFDLRQSDDPQTSDTAAIPKTDDRRHTFQLGDVVVLKSGGPEMTITGLGCNPNSPTYWCSWMHNGEMRQAERVPGLALRNAPDEEALLTYRALEEVARRPDPQILKIHLSGLRK